MKKVMQKGHQGHQNNHSKVWKCQNSGDPWKFNSAPRVHLS